jgi:protein ATS1
MVLLATGSNGAGQLGLGHTEDVCIFTDCHFEGKVKAMASGGSHTLLLAQSTSCRDLVLYGAGSNAHGQLGQGPDLLGFTPLSIPHPADYSPVLIACAWTTSYIVYRSSSPSNPDLLASLGSNDFDELGDGDLKLPNNENIKSVSSGQRHVLCLIESTTTPKQRILGWGAARHGQLSSPCQDFQPQSTPSRGKGKALPRSFASPVEIGIPAAERIAGIAVGSTHSVYLTESGKVLSAGSDAKGQRSQLPSVADRVVDIGCCWNGTSCLLQNGCIHTSGSNTHGQLARSDDLRSPLVTAPPVDNFVCGSEHILAMTRHDRNLLVCGWNEHGNLGLGDKQDRDCMTVVSGFAPFSNSAWIHAGCGTSFLYFE